MTVDRRVRLAKPSRRLLAAFHLYLHWYMRRHFHALRVAHAERLQHSAEGPRILYINHASWWDPLTGIMLARHFLPSSDHYAAMDEAALRRYSFFGKIGVFPVEIDTPRGAVQFLRTSVEALASPAAVLWLTPEGRFTDPRTRPANLKTGLASLLTHVPRVSVQPLAIEYIFWDEPLPEILVNWGKPVPLHDGAPSSIKEWNDALRSALTDTQDELATLAISRDASNFKTLLSGQAGIGAVYDAWRRLRSAANGERYEAEHGSIPR